MSLSHCWLTTKEISITNAAHLAVGLYPEGFVFEEARYNYDERKHLVDPITKYILERVFSGELKAKIKHLSIISDGTIVIENEDLPLSLQPGDVRNYINKNPEVIYVSTYELKNLFVAVGFDEDFFVKNAKLIDTNHLRAIKNQFTSETICLSNTLEAAISVYEFLKDNPESLKNQSPKQAIIDWLEKNYKAYNLVNSRGTHSNKAIQAIASVVNWNKTGGTPPIG